MHATRLTFVLCFGMVSCAVGVDTGADETAGYDAGPKTDGSSAAVDSALGAQESGPTLDAGTGEAGLAEGDANDDGSASGEGGVAEAGSPPIDSGTVVDSAPPTDAGTPSSCAGQGTTGALVTYDLSSQSGSEASVLATTAVIGVAAGPLSRAPALTAASGSGSINSSNWSTGTSADPTKYYTFTVTPGTGCTVTLTSVALDVSASGTGPAKGDVATSADGFTTHTTAFAGTSNTTVALSNVSGTGAIEVRAYGYGAMGSAGTFRISQTLTVSGTIE